jgi:glycosyltransferase involved in cell wall biosynthesis
MKPNVLQLIGSFNQGGSERQAVQLARLLHEAGHFRVHVACLDGSGPLRREIEQLGLGEITEFPMTSFYDRNTVTQLRRFGRYLRDRKIDILHTHDFYTNVFGMAGASFSRAPVIRIASRRETGGMRSRAQKFLQHRVYLRADAIVANADAVRAVLIAEGLRESKISTIYNGLDLKRLTPSGELDRPRTLEQFGLAGAANRRFVTIVANMRHVVKDHRTFLRAANRVKEEVADSAFVIAGEGELLESLKAFASELGLAKDAYFIGRCDRVADLLAVSEVCVLSSTNEGFSNSILEYMSASRPVVVTDVGGAREAVIEGKTGFIVSSGDYKKMAIQITNLLRDPVRAAEMGRQSRRVVEERFSCEAQLARTEELYEKLVALRLPSDLASRAEMSQSENVPASDRS